MAAREVRGEGVAAGAEEAPGELERPTARAGETGPVDEMALTGRRGGAEALQSPTIRKRNRS